jgi:hypothetical protein
VEDRLIIGLMERQQGQVIDQAITINTLRARVNQLEGVNAEMAMAHAETNAPLQALDEITDYLIERTRVERDASREPGMWARTALGNSIALTLYQDLCTKLDKIRTSHGL